MSKKKTLIFTLKIIVSGTLLYYIITKINWTEALQNFNHANYFLIFLVFLSNILERVELTYKWNILIRVRGLYVSFIRLFLINLIGGFWGLFLPSSVSTDVIRGYYLVKNNSEKSISISSVLVDRILSLFALLLFCVVFVLIGGDVVAKYKMNIYLPLLFIVSLVFFYFFQKEKTAGFIEKIFRKINIKKLTSFIVKLHLSILEYKQYPRALLQSFLINLLVQVTRVITYYLIAMAFGISVPIIYFFLFIPVIMLVLIFPISIGGLGIREGTFIAFFSMVGMSINDAVIITFTSTFIDTLNTLFGGIAYLFFNSSEAKRVPIKNLSD